LSTEKNSIDTLNNLVYNDQGAMDIDAFAGDIVQFVRQAKLSKSDVKTLQQKINNELNADSSTADKVSAFRVINTRTNDRLELAADLESLLLQTQLDSKMSSRYIFTKKLKNVSVTIIGIVMLVLGFAMIIMPAPKYFEMFTIFYFNSNDGVTLMDLISLLIVFTGVYLILISILKTLPGKASNA
jgi:hypothetical protein